MKPHSLIDFIFATNMPRDTASSLPLSRPPPPRTAPPPVTPSRISPPRISPPQVNANRVCSGSHIKLKEEKMVQVKRAIPVTKVSPPTPTPTRQPAAQDTENVPVQTHTPEPPVIENIVVEERKVPPPSPTPTRQPAAQDTENIPVQTQTHESPVIENVVVEDPNPLPRNTGLVQLAPRDENISTQEPRQRMVNGKHKIKFSISCVTVSTASSDQGDDSQQEDDALDPFAPPAPSASVTVAPQQQSLLTESLMKHGLVMRPASSTIGVTDQASNSSQSRAPDRSTETAQTAGRVNWVDPAVLRKLLRERDILVYGPFQREKGKRYFDEPIPAGPSRPNPVPPSKPLKHVQPSKPLKHLLPSKPLKHLPPSKSLKHLPPSKLLKPTAPPSPSKPLKPTAPPFPSEPSCPELTPSSVAIPARVGRAPNRPPVDRPPPDRPPSDRPRQQAEQARQPKPQAPGQANVRRRGRPPVDGEVRTALLLVFLG
jgi:hypothetical protein